MAVCGSRALALVMAIPVAVCAACAAVAGINSDPESTPPEGAPPEASDATAVPDASKADVSTAKDAAPAVDSAPQGAWFQANAKDCVPFCSGRGMTNVPSAEGAKCTSGENIPQSAIAAGITYEDCFPNCSAHLAGPNPTSSGEDCYATNQNKDSDPSDVTRGCFCK